MRSRAHLTGFFTPCHKQPNPAPTRPQRHVCRLHPASAPAWFSRPSPCPLALFPGSAFGEFAEPEAQNARQQTARSLAHLHHAHQQTGEPLHFRRPHVSYVNVQYLISIASTHFPLIFPR